MKIHQWPHCTVTGWGIYEVAVRVKGSKGRQEVGVPIVTVQTCLMGQPNAGDQQFLMTCHLQVVWGALPLRFMTHVVVTTGMTLSSTPDKRQVNPATFFPVSFLAFLFLLINWVIANLQGLSLLQAIFRFTERLNLQDHCSILSNVMRSL